MSKPHRSQREKTPTETQPAPTEPTPPRRHPLLLLATAVAMALWLTFLLWMAVRPAH
ncbi:MAG TPA: hypothetical protein VG125_06605 [Pirellulales bacterium]|nr:hypothetical protein [Pirellulales bacterium]